MNVCPFVECPTDIPNHVCNANIIVHPLAYHPKKQKTKIGIDGQVTIMVLVMTSVFNKERGTSRTCKYPISSQIALITVYNHNSFKW